MLYNCTHVAIVGISGLKDICCS